MCLLIKTSLDISKQEFPGWSWAMAPQKAQIGKSCVKIQTVHNRSYFLHGAESFGDIVNNKSIGVILWIWVINMLYKDCVHKSVAWPLKVTN